MMMIRRPMSSRLLLQAVLAVAAVFGSACSPVGNGIGPVRLVINGPTGTVDQASARVFQCVRNALSATVYFSDGSVGDFTNRVVWTSSNPAVIRISNGDEPAPAPSTGFFGYGVYTPVSDGTATITANYLGLTDTIQMSVGTPTNITVHTVNPQNFFKVDPPNNAFRIGVGTVQDLTVTALLDNVETNLDGAATWSFDAPNTAVATIGPASGLISGIGAGGPLTARASFPACSLSAATSVTVAPVQSISITPEFGSSNLIVGNSELFTVRADFGNGPEQDISFSSTLTSSNTAAGVFNTAIGTSNILVGLTAAGPFNVSATFTPPGGTAITASPVPVTTVAGTLQAISITPTTASVVAGSDQVAQYNVIGDYGNGVTQDVTRRAVWTSSDNAVGQVSGLPQQAGQALSYGTTPGTATFTATVAQGTTNLTATTAFTSTAPPASP